MTKISTAKQISILKKRERERRQHCQLKMEINYSVTDNRKDERLPTAPLMLCAHGKLNEKTVFWFAKQLFATSVRNKQNIPNYFLIQDGLGSTAFCLFFPGGKSDHNSISNLAPHSLAINTTLRNIAPGNVKCPSQTHSQSKDLGPTWGLSAAPDKISYHILSLDEDSPWLHHVEVPRSAVMPLFCALNVQLASHLLCLISSSYTDILPLTTKFPPNPQNISMANESWDC